MMKKIKYIILILIPIFILSLVVYMCVSNYIKIEYKKTDKNIGKYKRVQILEEEVADKYLNRILDIVESKDYESIVSYIDRDNSRYTSLSSLEIKEEFERLGILGKKLEKSEYSTNYVDTLNNSFNYILLDKETNKTYNLNIKEFSPNIFTFSF